MDMILAMQNNTITGKVINENEEGVANIWVNAWSNVLETGNGASNGKSIQTVSDKNGEYVINGLQTGNSYFLNVFPSSESNSAFIQKRVEISENDQKQDVELSSGINMRGQVIDKNSSQGINSATVIFQSKSTGYYNIIQTNESGEFEFFNMPETMDYDVSVISSNYQNIYLENQQATQYRTFQMTSSGSVTGMVVNKQSGSGISGASPCTLFSQYIYFTSWD